MLVPVIKDEDIEKCRLSTLEETIQFYRERCSYGSNENIHYSLDVLNIWISKSKTEEELFKVREEVKTRHYSLMNDFQKNHTAPIFEDMHRKIRNKIAGRPENQACDDREIGDTC